jgi:hypothetical protein
MPNWITNKLIINADETMVQKILSQVNSEESLFDFNKIIPQPKELDDTTAPAMIISDEEYFISPNKGITQSMSDELISKYGYNNWYDWRYHNWGTKWNSDEVNSYDNEVEFNTAWCNPMPLFVKLSQMFPEVDFRIEYADEDFGYNVGKYTLLNGNVTDMFIPEGGSKEAYELAMEIKGDNDYYIYDVFLDVNEEEEIGNYYKTLIEIAYEREKVVTEEMPIIILNEFLSLSLEREDYEFASKVKETIEKKNLELSKN